MTELCNIDGVITKEADARIPILDRGFLFGDSIYEVIGTLGGIPFCADEHLVRLRASAAGILLNLPFSDDEIFRRVKTTLRAAENPESYIRIIVTRGSCTAPSIALEYAVGVPRLIIMVRAFDPKPVKPAELLIVKRLRNDRRALDPAVKSGNYLNNVLGLAEATLAGATDAVFLNGDGHVTEASTSNLFVVRHGKVMTPPLWDGLLSGVTRRMLLDLCRDAGVSAEERSLTAADLADADEIFLSSTLRHITAAVTLDGRPVADGKPGPMTRRLVELFEAAAERRSADICKPRYAAL